MKTNNGKIAIAVVAMFVVALSVIGFTYAYFTARITGNTNDKSVEVSAGQLVVNYTTGNVIKAENIVPGWKSDGLSYYKADYTDANNNIIAKHGTSITDEIFVADAPTSAVGLTSPATFTVENTGDNKNAAYYVVRLKNITNSLKTEVNSVDSEGTATTHNDATNMKLSLYKGSFEDYSSANDTLVYKTTLSTTTATPQVIVPRAMEVANGATDNYYIMLEYLNADFDQADDMGSSISATVEIVGVTVRDGVTYDADGTTINFTATE